MKRPIEADSPPTASKVKKAKKAKRDPASAPSFSFTSESSAITSDAARKEAKKAKKQRKEKAKKEEAVPRVPPKAAEDMRANNDIKVKDKEKTTKRKHKSKREISGPLPTPGEGARAAPGPAAAAVAVPDGAVQTIIARVAEDGSPTLSDLLNPDHGAFDSDLKAQWKSLPKKGRAAIVAADLRRIADLRRAGEEALSRLPFVTEPGSLASGSFCARLRTPPVFAALLSNPIASHFYSRRPLRVAARSLRRPGAVSRSRRHQARQDKSHPRGAPFIADAPVNFNLWQFSAKAVFVCSRFFFFSAIGSNFPPWVFIDLRPVFLRWRHEKTSRGSRLRAGEGALTHTRSCSATCAAPRNHLVTLFILGAQRVHGLLRSDPH